MIKFWNLDFMKSKGCGYRVVRVDAALMDKIDILLNLINFYQRYKRDKKRFSKDRL